jgi:SAM-dependent methyltransferase
MSDGRTANGLETLKNRLRDTWISGEYGRIARSFERGAEKFVERLGLKPGMRVLDVACGTGNLTLPAARTGADVTGLDFAPNLIEEAKANAAAEGLNINFDVGDAEDMPYEDESFDVVISMFGAMFTPRPDVTASELKRVCRPGGLVAMANWRPESLIGQMFKVLGKHVTPPVGMPSPLLWGDQEAVERRFGKGIADMQFSVRPIEMMFPFEPAETVETFRKFYGPTFKAFNSIEDPERQAEMRKDLEELWTISNASQNGCTLVFPEYLEVKATVS